MSTIVIMPGGFHPFHAGHMALYNSARQAFPNADLYVAATNSQEERPFPFAVKEKLAKVAGVAPGHFVQVKSPFQAKEITQNYNPEQDVLIFVRSEKDRNESPKPGGTKKDGSPAYFQPWTGKDVQPFSKHAYFAYLPTVKFGPGITSATEIRKAWPTLNDKRKTAMVMSLYPATQKNPKLAANVVAMLDQVMGGQEQLAEASYMSLDDYKNNLQNALPSIIEYYQDELGFIPSKEQLASAVKAAHATMERTGDTEQAGESLEAVLDSFVPSNSSNKNSPKIDFKKNLLQVLQQKYPDAEFKIGPDRVESIDGQLSVIADTEQEGKYVGCFMWDVSTGPYKGALGLAIKKTTDQLLQANPGKKPALFISGDNQTPEAWAYIAKKLKYKLITDEDELEEGYFDDEDNEPPYHTRILDRQTKKIIADDGPYESENEAVDRAEAYLAWAKTKNMSIVAQVYQPEHGKNYVTWQVPDEGDYTVKEQGVAEGFGINYPGTYEQENNMFKGHGQRRIGNLTSENIDPELINVLQYAQQHYPNSKNKQEAFMKFVQRALGHSKSDDERQDNELERLDKEVDQLQKQVNVSESTDYLEEK